MGVSSMSTVRLVKGGELLVYGWDVYWAEDDALFGQVIESEEHFWFEPSDTSPPMSCRVMLDIANMLSRINKAGSVENELLR
jgi:hypothetical protein